CRDNCANWTFISGIFPQRCSCERPSKDIWKASGSSGCDFGSRTISDAGEAAMEQPRIAARRGGKPAGPPVESARSRTTSGALRAGGRGFESHYTRSVGARATTISRAVGGASVCGAALRSADALRNLAAAPLAENFHVVPGNVSPAVALFRSGRADYGVGLRAG